MKTIEDKKLLRPDTSELENIAGINPNIFIHELSKFHIELVHLLLMLAIIRCGALSHWN